MVGGTCRLILARLLPCSDQRLCIKAAATGGWEVTQPAPARDGGTFEAASARYGRGFAGFRFLSYRLGGFWRSAYGYAGAFTRQWRPSPTPRWNLHLRRVPPR